MVKGFPLNSQAPRGGLMPICSVGISAIKDVYISPFPDTLSFSFLSYFACLPTLVLAHSAPLP